MPFIIVGSERCTLESGETVLGGDVARGLHAESIAHISPFAAIVCTRDGPSTIRAVGSEPVRLNGAPLGAEPNVLQHLDRIEVAGIVLVYGDSRILPRDGHAIRDTQRTTIVALDDGYGEPTASTGGQLTRLADRSVHPISARGITIGRDPSSDIVLTSRDVSPKHVTIVPALLGYTLTDHSYRGVWVNGSRIESSCVLRQRSEIRVDTETFRFEADVGFFEPDFESASPSLKASAARVRREEDAAIAATAPAVAEETGVALATLEVVSDGRLKGQVFRIARATVQIGRSQYNDVRLDEDSVSSRHASLVMRDNRWIIFDVRSTNGTYVEGQLVHDHRVLPSACELRFGRLKLMFHSVVAGYPSGNLPRGAADPSLRSG
jgi:pSer/pThr/pTyr-binding forkhead associated (FHA) protein